ncbi:MAG: hypothetical protein AAFP90_03420, partial [Planctomycetota bacterium]
MNPLTQLMRFLCAATTAIALLCVMPCAATTVDAAHYGRLCPYCSSPQATLRQEMDRMDAVVIATATGKINALTERVQMRVEKILKPCQGVNADVLIDAAYYGKLKAGQRFICSGIDPDDLQWNSQPLTPVLEDYYTNIATLTKEPVDQLRFYHQYLEHEEQMIAQDAYDEFAGAPYEMVGEISKEFDHDQLIRWIQDPEVTSDRRRLYFTMLGLCGGDADLP